MAANQGQFDFDSGGRRLLESLTDAPFSPTRPWSQQLTRRQRVLLHIEPILRLYRQPGTRDDRHLQYDTLALIVKVFDTVIDQTGFGSEVTDETVLEAAKPLLKAWDEASGNPAGPDVHSDVMARILAELKNERERQEPFEVPYQAFDDAGDPRRHVLRFKLLMEQFGYDGGIVLRLSSEAINLFLNAFGLDIEDAQVANEAVVQSQLERGKFNEAVQSAQNARGQSMRYEAKIRWLLLQIGRDIDRIDWRGEADGLLREALEHVQRRLHVEDNILRSAEEKLDNLAESDDRRPSLAEVIRLMKECQRRHLLLHEQLMPARGEYLRQQARQAFVASRIRQSVDLRDAVLRDVLQQPRLAATELLDGPGGMFLGPLPPALLNIRALVHWQLMPKRQSSKGLVPVDDLELNQTDGSERRFSDEAVQTAAEFLAGVQEKARLSTLIGSCEAAGHANDSVDAMILQAIRTFGDDAGGLGYRVDIAEMAGLHQTRHHGDDVWIVPNGEEVTRVEPA